MIRLLLNQARQELWSADQDRLVAAVGDQSKDRLIVNFFSVPAEIEKLMLYGYLVCLDAFLTTITFFPIRFCISIFSIIIRYVQFIFRRRDFASCAIPLADLRLIVKGLLLIISCYLVQLIDASQLYHSIRGQSVIKLYVIFNVLEIADRLCCSFGQDILDALLNGLRAESSLPSIPNFLLALAYVFGHTLVLFYQMITLNVAINSHNNALLTLLVSNQFVEIKGSVFKKFEKENLFQLSCSDIVERFQLSLFLAIITFRNLSEFGAEWSVFSVDIPSQLGSWTQPITDSLMPLLEAPVEAPLHVWNFLSQTGPSVIYDIITHPFTFSLDIDAYYSLFDALVYPVLIVFATEVLVDWIKHAFISKFNHIRPSVYSKYLSVLCKDYVLGPCKTMPTFKEGETLPILMNNSMHVARRIGFAAMPLACLLVRILLQMIASTGWAKCDDDSPFILHCSYSYVMTFIVIMPVLFIVKCFLSIGLARFSLDRYRSSIITSKNPVDQSAALIMPSTLRMMRPPAFSAGSAQRRMPSYWDLDDVPHISRLYSIPTSPDVSTSLLHTGGNYSAPVVSSSQSTINQAENEPTNNAATIAIISAHTDSPTTPSSSGTPTPILESIDRFTMLKGRIP